MLHLAFKLLLFSLSDLGITLDFLKAIQIKETSLEIKYIENHFFHLF